MLKVTKAELDKLEGIYPGIVEQINRFENAVLPPCTSCGSYDTAQVSVGLVGRSINIVICTTRIRLMPNGPKPGEYACNTCRTFFNAHVIDFRGQ
jgi:hypothetical protein